MTTETEAERILALARDYADQRIMASRDRATSGDVEESYTALKSALEARDAEIERLRVEADDHEAELDEAARGPWAEWSLAIMKSVRERSGYDGFDDQDGVDLPAEVEECLQELERLIDKRTAERDALRQRLDDASKQEPVAWRGRPLAEEDWCLYWSKPHSVEVVEALYTSPKPAEPLTDEQVAESILTADRAQWLADNFDSSHDHYNEALDKLRAYSKLIRDLLAAHGIGGQP